MKTDSFAYRAAIGVVLATGLILLAPLIAMQFMDGVNWTVSDFAVAGVLLLGTGLISVLAATKLPRYRVVIGIALAAALLWLWAELAVGVFTNWGS